MRRELNYFQIEGSFGGSQDWLTDWMMRMGGCAAVTACDSCIYMALRQGRRYLYPYDADRLSRADFLRFSAAMKPYLHPRLRGIDKLEIFEKGLGKYFKDRGEDALTLRGLQGERPYEEAERALVRQIDGNFPVPFLLLRHQSPDFQNYGWHWFILAGYEIFEGIAMVKAVTYGHWRWLDFRELWNTGYRERGGMILIEPQS